jgi:FtsH-binding integral membrane protein
MDLRESKLPWQFVVLGFFGFGAIFAVMLLVFSFMPSMEMGRSTKVIVWYVSVPYLGVGLGVLPYLIRTGSRNFNALNPKNSLGEREIPRMSTGKRLVVSSIALTAGVLMSLYSYSQVDPTAGGHYTIYLGLIGVGLIGVISALLAPSD